MHEENSPKEEKGHGQQQQPEIQKGWNTERSWEHLRSPDHGGLKEGYQPIRDIATPPPGGGSGVPDKDDNK